MGEEKKGFNFLSDLVCLIACSQSLNFMEDVESRFDDQSRFSSHISVSDEHRKKRILLPNERCIH